MEKKGLTISLLLYDPCGWCTDHRPSRLRLGYGLELGLAYRGVGCRPLAQSVRGGGYTGRWPSWLGLGLELGLELRLEHLGGVA